MPEKDSFREQNMRNFGKIIIVMSGKGGVGKSTVCVNTAYALASTGYRVGIMDIDFHGPSIAKMTRSEGFPTGVSSRGNPAPVQVAENIHVLSIAPLLGSADDAVIWRGPMKMGVINQFLDDIEWPNIDYLLVDCPPGTGDEPLSIIQAFPSLHGTMIVTTPQDVALLDARKAITFARKLEVPVLGIVENMSGFTCPHCGEYMDIFQSGGAAKAAADFAIPILAKIPLQAAIAASGDSGIPHVTTSDGEVFTRLAASISLEK